MAETHKPTLILPVAHFKKLMAYVDLCDGEVTGFFDVDYIEDRKAFVMGEVHLIKQEAGAASVEMDEDNILDAMDELIAAGVTQMPRGWWHSHVEMQAFFSGTDNQTIDSDFLNDTFTVSLVVNKRREMKATLVVFEDGPYNLYEAPLRIDDLKIKLDGELEEIPEALRQEVRAKVLPYKNEAQPYQYQGQGSMGFNMNASKKKSTTKALPKKEEEALEKIQKLNLQRRWNLDLKQIIYEDDETGELWDDVWRVVTYSAYNQIMPNAKEAKVFLGEGPKIAKPRRCLNCQYYEGQHNANVCDTEQYGPEEYYTREYLDYEGED